MNAMQRFLAVVAVAALLALPFQLFTTGTVRAAGAIEGHGSAIATSDVGSLDVSVTGGTPSNGETLAAVVGTMDASADIGFPAGWTEAWESSGSRGTCAMGYKVAASEASATFTFTIDGSQEMVAGMWVISGVGSTPANSDFISGSAADSLTFDLGTVSDNAIAVGGICYYATGGTFGGSWATGGTATSSPTSGEPADQNSGSGTDVTGSYGWADITAGGTFTFTSKSKTGSLSERLAGGSLVFDDGGAPPTPTPTPTPTIPPTPWVFVQSRKVTV